jgi:hypothetical protein
MQFPFTYQFIHCCFPSLPNQAFILCGSYFDAEKSKVWWHCLTLPQTARPNVKNTIDNCGPTSPVMIKLCGEAFNESDNWVGTCCPELR